MTTFPATPGLSFTAATRAAETTATPLGLRIFFGAVLVLAGISVLTIGFRGLRGTLPRNRVAGVRTKTTMASDEAFAVGNRVAAPATLAAGAVGLVTGVVSFFVGGGITLGIVIVIGALGALVLAGLGGVLGHRAAALVSQRPVGGCGGGCCCGAGACR